MNELVSRRTTMLRTFDEQNDIFVSSSSLHFDFLKAKFNFQEVMKTHMHGTGRIISRLGSSWTADLTRLSTAIDQCTPKWEPMRESLLDHREMVRALIDNPSRDKSSPLAAELKAQAAVCRKLVAGVMEPGCCKTANRSVDSAIETLALTYALTCIVDTWPNQVLNVPMASQMVRDLEKEMDRAKVKLPQQLLNALEEWRTGAHLSEPRDTSASAATSAPPLLQPPPADTSASAITSAAAVTDVLLSGKRRRLAKTLQ